MTRGEQAIAYLNENGIARPLDAALFLIAVLLPPRLSISTLTWDDIDFEEGTMRGRPTPERILELLEDTERGDGFIFHPDLPRYSVTTLVKSMRDNFDLMFAENRGVVDEDNHVDTPAHVVRHWVTKMQSEDKHKGCRYW